MQLEVARKNALECYHCPIVHKHTFSQYYRVDVDGYVNGTYQAQWSLLWFQTLTCLDPWLR